MDEGSLQQAIDQSQFAPRTAEADTMINGQTIAPHATTIVPGPEGLRRFGDGELQHHLGIISGWTMDLGPVSGDGQGGQRQQPAASSRQGSGGGRVSLA